MKKFEIANVEYRFNEESGRYSKVENGKTVRIGKAEYEEAASKPVNVKTIPCEDGDRLVEFAKIGTEYGIRFVGDKIFHSMTKEEVEMKTDSRVGDMKFVATFEFMGHRYWLKDAINTGTSKKSKKSSRSKKNAAYRKQFGDVEICLTEKQVDFFRHMQDTCFWEQGLDSTPWIDVLCDEIGGQFAGKPMTVGAMVSTLKEKDLLVVMAERVNGCKKKFFELTELGKQVATELGLK